MCWLAGWNRVVTKCHIVEIYGDRHTHNFTEKTLLCATHIYEYSNCNVRPGVTVVRGTRRRTAKNRKTRKQAGMPFGHFHALNINIISRRREREGESAQKYANWRHSHLLVFWQAGGANKAAKTTTDIISTQLFLMSFYRWPAAVFSLFGLHTVDVCAPCCTSKKKRVLCFPPFLRPLRIYVCVSAVHSRVHYSSSFILCLFFYFFPIFFY